MANYSHSKLGTYENCPQQYKLRYIDRIELPEETEGIEAFLGTRVHDVLEKLHKELILSKMNTLDDLLAYYADEWKKNFHKNVLIVKKQFNEDHYKASGEEAIRNYYRRYKPFNQSKTLSTEYMIAFKLEEHNIQGFIDRLSCSKDGVYEIHDYKTAGSLPTQSKFDEDRQLALYQIGIKEKFRDVNGVKLIWHYLLFDKEFISERTEHQLEDLKKQILSLIKTIEKDTKFSPIESNLCNWCEYAEFCLAKKHQAKVKDLPPNQYLREKGVVLVNEYAAITSKIKNLRKEQSDLQEELDLIADAAILYAKKEGVSNIVGSEFVLKVTEKTGLSFPHSGDDEREALEQLLKEAGLWEQVSSLALGKLKTLTDESTISEKIRKRLLEFAEEETETNVRLVLKKDGTED